MLKTGQNLSGLFDQLALPYQNKNSVGGYKGMASEIIAALRVAAHPAGPAVRIPDSNKPIDPLFATTKDKTVNSATAKAATTTTVTTGGVAPPPVPTSAKLLEQDIDRTGTVRWWDKVLCRG